jgi:DNA-binding MarR family transcriptional regulator
MVELVGKTTDHSAERRTLVRMAGRVSKRGPFLLSYAIDQQVTQLLDLTFVEAPLRPGEFAIYSVLNLVQETTPSELAQDLGMSRSTLSNWLRRMDSRGHLVRRSNPGDGRSHLVSLTESGREVTLACFPAFGLAISTFRAHLVGDEDVVLAAMEAMSAALAGAVGQLSAARAPSGGPQSLPAALSSR